MGWLPRYLIGGIAAVAGGEYLVHLHRFPLPSLTHSPLVGVLSGLLIFGLIAAKPKKRGSGRPGSYPRGRVRRAEGCRPEEELATVR
jgi:hypothetical protein